MPEVVEVSRLLEDIRRRDLPSHGSGSVLAARSSIENLMSCPFSRRDSGSAFMSQYWRPEGALEIDGMVGVTPFSFVDFFGFWDHSVSFLDCEKREESTIRRDSCDISPRDMESSCNALIQEKANAQGGLK